MKTAVLAGAIFASTSAFADCTVVPQLVTDIINGTQNSTVCVDELVTLNNEKVVFNLDSAATTDGLTGATSTSMPIGLRHMWMLATANKARILEKGLNPKQFSIIGIFHGSAAKWALSDQWWIDNVPGATGNPYKGWINRVLAFQNDGIDVQLEICGVTMSGNHWSNIPGSSWVDAAGTTHTHAYSDVYPGIRVNQGAIGRLIDLEQNKGYAYIQEGFVDSDQPK